MLATTVGAGSPTLADSAPLDPPVEVAEPPEPEPEPDPVLVGAGDVAYCGSDNDEATATLLDDIAGTVFTVGDNAYLDGTPEEFTECYEPTWGRHKARTTPAVGTRSPGPEPSAYTFTASVAQRIAGGAVGGEVPEQQ